MKKLSALIISIIMVVTVLTALPFNAVAAQYLPTDVNTPSSDCVLLGIEGKYIVDTENALNRINEIRLEACREGVINPSTSKPLTMNDYVPIKWSSDLEYVARIRAAEASITMDHKRTNGESCFALSSPNGIGGRGEVIAWNGSTSVISGINQWYGEKSDWVKQNKNAVTGHYTQMINPRNTYVGLGTFCSDAADFYNTTCGQFSSATSLDETRGVAVNNCIQVLEVAKSFLTGKYEINGSSELKVGKTEKYNLLTSVKVVDYWGYENITKGLYVLSDVTWSVSDSNIASVVNNEVTANRCGSVSVTATDYAGRTARKDITIPHDYSNVVLKATLNQDGVARCSFCNSSSNFSHPEKIELSTKSYTYNGKVRNPSVTVKDSKGNIISSDYYTVSYAKGRKAVGKYNVNVTFNGIYSDTKKLSFNINPANTAVSSLSTASKGFTVKWKKKTTQTSGYEIQYSTDSKFKKGNKSVVVSKNSASSKKISGIKGNKRYYVRIRTYKVVNSKKYYSSWSKAKSVVAKR